MWNNLPLLAKVLSIANVLLVTAVSLTGFATYRIASDSIRAELIASGMKSVVDFAKINALDFVDEEKGRLNLSLALSQLVAPQTNDAEQRFLAGFVFDRDGNLLAKATHGRFPSPDPGVLPTLTSAAVVPAMGTQSSIAVASPVSYDNVSLGYVVFQLDAQSIARAGSEIIARSVAIVVAALVLNFLALMFLMSRILRPVRELGSASEAFAGGDFRRRIEGKLAGDEVGTAARSFNNMADALELHVRYSNDALVERIRSGGGDAPVEHQLSVVFGDAVGYTTWAASHTPEQIFAMLSRYYTCIGRITVHSFQGIIDKFIGDGIMMHFGMLKEDRGALVHEKDYVRSALRSTIYSQFALRILSYAILKIERDKPLSYRFGLASGKCMMGAVGAQEIMMDYSIIGNVVNLAARLEGRAPPGGLIIDRFTYIDAEKGFVEVNDGGRQRVKGIPDPVQVYYVKSFSEQHELEEMRRYFLQDFLEDPLVLRAILGPNMDSTRHREALRRYAIKEFDKHPTLPCRGDETVITGELSFPLG